MPRLFWGGVLAHLMQHKLEKYDCSFYPANARGCSCMPQSVISCSVYLKIQLPLKNFFLSLQASTFDLSKTCKKEENVRLKFTFSPYPCSCSR